MSFWVGKKILVTGGGGFLGSYVIEKLRCAGCESIFAPRSTEVDLRERGAIVQLFKQIQPEMVIHLAAVVGGIGANRRHPGQFFYDNAVMGVQLMEYARRYGVAKFVCIGTVCAYPKLTPVPFHEDNLWNGYPEETNAPYGLAKKMLLVQAQSYRKEYGFNAVYLLPVNLYGPRDNFDVESSHVIPALIHKCVQARETGEDKILAWGTGNVSREFLFVEDAATAIVLAAECYNKGEPVNVGTGQEIKIRDLACLVRELTGFPGRIQWDATQPDGQPRRCLDTSRAEREFNFKARTSIREGLTKTIAWYETTLAARLARAPNCAPRKD